MLLLTQMSLRTHVTQMSLRTHVTQMSLLTHVTQMSLRYYSLRSSPPITASKTQLGRNMKHRYCIFLHFLSFLLLLLLLLMLFSVAFMVLGQNIKISSVAIHVLILGLEKTPKIVE